MFDPYDSCVGRSHPTNEELVEALELAEAAADAAEQQARDEEQRLMDEEREYLEAEMEAEYAAWWLRQDVSPDGTQAIWYGGR